MTELTEGVVPKRLAIAYRPVAELATYARNARTHSEEQVAQLAASIEAYGWTNPILVDENGGIVAGHGRLRAAQKLAMAEVPTICLAGLTAAQRRALVLADNKLALNAGWDFGLLRDELAELDIGDFDMSVIGFSGDELEQIATWTPATGTSSTGRTDPDAAPPPPAVPVSRAGDLWLLGPHRLMCGDSTHAGDVARLVGDGARSPMLHADPPYGMGKESDGVANDNLYRDKLDAFQMRWWSVWRRHIDDNASAYIWGNAPDLWRLWYRGGLGDSEKIELRNEIVWDKKSIAGMASPLMTQYPMATERCLFLQLGDQFIGNVNADQYFDGWDEIRLYLAAEASAAQLTVGRCAEITGTQMYGHWFSRSQWAFISRGHYATLALATGRFQRPYDELRAVYDRIKGGYRSHINGILGGMRSYFDNAHDAMRDVWEFARVVSDDRHGHATPKPVAMMERAILSSCPEGGVCLEPFAGTGSTLMGAEKTGRRCYTMELTPAYVDVCIKRWEAFTGKAAEHNDGRTFAEIAAERVPEQKAA